MTATPERSIMSLQIRADPGEFRQASSWLRLGGSALGMPEDQIDRLELCLNEVLANLVEHGGEPVARHPIRLELDPIERSGGSGARLVISDAGLPFDPGQARLKPLPGSLAEASPGGLGLRLVEALTDAMAYQVMHDRNELRIEMHWTPRS
jgi:anti-sigma regulatory factor (Ser/Thr protein kinase)